MCKTTRLAAFMTVVLAVPAFAAEPSEPSALSPDALTTPVKNALSDLASEDFKTRQAALAKLQLALGQQIRLLIASDDPEVQARLAELLQFNDALSRWALDAMKLPADQRKAQLDFGLTTEVMPIIGQVYSIEVDHRVDGARALAKLASPQATVMLGHLVDDSERAVYLAAMEAVWDRKPNDAVIDALWTRAVESGFAGYRQVVQQPNAVFRGRAVQGNFFVSTLYTRGQDATIAGDVLLHFNSPLVADKLKSFLVALETMSTANPYVFSSNSEQLRNVYRLVEAYNTKGVLEIMIRMATAPAKQHYSGMINNEKYTWSTRTGPLATVIVATGQKTEDYKLKKQQQQFGGMWCTATEEDENEAVKKLQEWIAANPDKLTQPTAASQPNKAFAPPAEGAGAINQGGGAIFIQGGGGMVIQGQVQIQGGGNAGAVQVHIGPAPVLPAPAAEKK